MVDWISRWLARNTPDREELARNRWMRPFASRVLRSELWRFTRRSVPRGVAIGLLVGIFLMIPGLQIIGAAFLSVPFRANIPIAAAMTFLSNPATTPIILTASYFVGSLLGLGGQRVIPFGASLMEWLDWMLSDAAPALVCGLLVIAFAAAAIGYVIADIGWRWWQGRKWRRRGLKGGAEA